MYNNFAFMFTIFKLNFQCQTLGSFGSFCILLSKWKTFRTFIVRSAMEMIKLNYNGLFY